MLRVDCPGAKRPSYSIVYDGWHNPTADFTDISIERTPQGIFLKALHKGHTQVHERLLKLDAERYEQGDLPLPALLEKYCSYLRLQEGE
ncbi:MAG: hypothetical protein LUC86_05470 [Prevotellaceae bacterium]|nr:hypothetical protein [Prevotellaceae bacterium]